MGCLFNFFRKKKQTQTNEIICLDKWDRLKKLPDSYLYDIFRSTDLESIVIALNYSDQKMIDRFIDCSKLFHKEEKLKRLLERSNVSKNKSDKMKAHLANISGLDDPSHIQYEPYDSY
jgi:hypothetical protein